MEDLKDNRKLTNTFLFIFLFTLFSGALRKWVFTDKATANAIFLIQLLAPFFFFFFFKKYRMKVFTSRVISIYFIILFCEAFSPLNKTIFHGLSGILIHGGMWYALYFYLTNRQHFNFERLLNFIIIICVFEVILGFIQYGLPPDHFLNKYADEEKVGGIATIGGKAVRICGTFSYISGYTSFLLFYPFMMWVLIKKNFRPAITISLIFFGLIASFMSGSRTATFSYLLFMGYLFLFEIKSENIKGMLGGIVPPMVVLVLIFLAKGNIGFEDKIVNAFENFNERRNNLKESGEEQKRFFWEYEQLINFQGTNPLLGIGLGSTYQGATAIWGKSDLLLQQGYLETELTRVVVEGGFLLLVFRFILIVNVMSLLYIPAKSKIFLGLFILLAGGFVYNVYNAVFLFMGIVLVDNYYYTQLRISEDAEELGSQQSSSQPMLYGAS